MRHAILLLAISLLSACANNAGGPLAFNPEKLLHDQLFPEHRFYAIEREEEIFDLSPEAIAYVQQNIRSIDNGPKRLRQLISDIFKRADYNLLYQNSANNTAAETFRTGAANCLSLSILTFALAQEAGLEATFQNVEIPEYWTRRDGYSLLNGHINVKLQERQKQGFSLFERDGLVVDFYQLSIRRTAPSEHIDKTRVLAMFYNNKGADALINNDLERAFAYFREAVDADPGFESVWTNLGYLYRLVGAYPQAEEAYKLAIRLKPERLTAYENLGVLYQYQGLHDKADELTRRVERLRQSNPYYHFVQGEEAYDEGNFDVAKAHYRKALKLNNRHHEFYFGLAKVYFKLGELERSTEFMQKAKEYSPDKQLQGRYEGKMALLRQL